MGKELIHQRRQAKHLITVEGLTQKQAAEKTGVSERTVGKWAKRFRWESGKSCKVNKAFRLRMFLNDFSIPENINSLEIETKKFFATYMITVKGYQQKEVSKTLHVSEKTLSLWSKKYKWREKRVIIEKEHSKRLRGDRFFEFLKVHNPKLYKQVEKCLNDYLNGLNDEFERIIKSMENKQ